MRLVSTHYIYIKRKRKKEGTRDLINGGMEEWRINSIYPRHAMTFAADLCLICVLAGIDFKIYVAGEKEGATESGQLMS